LAGGVVHLDPVDPSVLVVVVLDQVGVSVGVVVDGEPVDLAVPVGVLAVDDGFRPTWMDVNSVAAR
jgi:hypothetical protein